MQNHGVVFLTCAREESRNVNQGNQWNVECVAEANKASALARSVAVEHAGKIFRLVGNDTHRLAVEASETYDDVLGVVCRHFKEFAVVDDCCDNVVHVVWHVGAFRDDFVEAVFEAVDWVGAFNAWSILKVVLRNVAEELANDVDGIFVAFGSEVGNTRLGSVNFGATESFLSNVFAGNGLNHLRTGEEHIRSALCHDGEVGECRRINSTAGARTKDGRDLWDYTRSIDVALEDFGIAGKSVDAFLNASAARVVKTDNRSAVLHCHVHHLAYLECESFGE